MVAMLHYHIQVDGIEPLEIVQLEKLDSVSNKELNHDPKSPNFTRINATRFLRDKDVLLTRTP